MSASTRRRKQVAACQALLALVVVAAGCGGGGSSTETSASSSTEASAEAKPAKVAYLVAVVASFQEATVEGLDKILKPHGGSVTMYKAEFNQQKQQDSAKPNWSNWRAKVKNRAK